MSLPTLGLEVTTGQVVDVDQDVAVQLSAGPDFELLDELTTSDEAGVKVTVFEVHVDPVVKVTRASAGSVYLADGTALTWSGDGGSVEMSPEQADQLRGYDAEFTFSDAPVPVEEAPAEALVSSSRKSRTAAPVEAPVEPVAAVADGA